MLPRSKGWKTKTTTNGWRNKRVALQRIGHFDLCTRARKVGQYRLFIPDEYGSDRYPEFKSYCEKNDVIVRCLPLHSSHNA